MLGQKHTCGTGRLSTQQQQYEPFLARYSLSAALHGLSPQLAPAPYPALNGPPFHSR